MSEYLCESLGKHHDRQGFHCGDTELDLWLQQRARQDQERHVAAVYVLVPVDEPTRVAGFYSLSATSVLLSDLPIDFARKLPRYPVVPAILLGRLARDLKFPGLGETLLLDALHRAWTNASKIAAAAVIVDAKNDRAREFYQRYGFQPIVGMADRLFVPVKTLGQTFRERP